VTPATLHASLPYLVAVWLLVCGLYGVVTSRNLIHLVGCLAVTQSSSYVLLAGIGHVPGGSAPVFLRLVSGPVVDPVVQAMMLTDVVVEATVSALLLALAIQVHTHAHTLRPDRLTRLRG
jgi:multicomponent Na+:H+ antiporter subunit C